MNLDDLIGQLETTGAVDVLGAGIRLHIEKAGDGWTGTIAAVIAPGREEPKPLGVLTWDGVLACLTHTVGHINTIATLWMAGRL